MPRLQLNEPRDRRCRRRGSGELVSSAGGIGTFLNGGNRMVRLRTGFAYPFRLAGSNSIQQIAHLAPNGRSGKLRIGRLTVAKSRQQESKSPALGGSHLTTGIRSKGLSQGPNLGRGSYFSACDCVPRGSS